MRRGSIVLAVLAALAVVLWLWQRGERQGPSSTAAPEVPAREAPAVRGAATPSAAPEAAPFVDAAPSQPAPAAAPPEPAPSEPSVPAVPGQPPAAEVAAPPEPAPAEPVAEEPPEASNPAAGLVWSLDREGIKAAVREASPAIRECYEGWLEDRPDLGGKLTVRFVVGADADSGEGRVREAVLVSSSLDQPFLEGCVLNALQELRFDRPETGDLTVNYPLRFDPDPEPQQP
jgi:hypothetical protein